MKKIIALILAVLCISSLSVFATAPVMEMTSVNESIGWEAAEITVNDDFTQLYYNGERFISFNSSTVDFGSLNDLNCAVTFTESQKQMVETVLLYINDKKTVISAEYTLENGGHLQLSYLKHSLADEYNSLMGENWNKGEIDFCWPEGNKVETTLNELLGKKENVFINDTFSLDFFNVKAYSDDKSLSVIKGQLLEINGEEYYYLDFERAGIENNGDFDIFDYDVVLAYKITNEELCDQIEDAIDEYYDDDYGFLDDDKFTVAVADIMLVLLFLIIPFAIFVLFLIFAILSKTYYKKYFRAIYISALVVIMLFIVMFLLL